MTETCLAATLSFVELGRQRMPKAVEQLIQIGKLVDLEVAPHRPRHRRTKLSEAGALIDILLRLSAGNRRYSPFLRSFSL